jgi:hypothetical protein
MKSWGVTCLILGVGSYVLPKFGMQFRLLSLFGEATPIVAAVLTVLGIVLLVVGARQDKQKDA